MKRREFLTLAAGGAAAWPLAGYAQQATMPRVGWLWSGRSEGKPSELTGFKQGLRDLGYVEGQNIVVDYRFGENSVERLTALAEDLARLKPDIILALGTPAIRVARRAVPDRPIVFLSGDPIGSGLIASLNRSGGHLTGLSMMLLSEKWPDLTREMLPAVTRIGYLWNPAEVRSASSFSQARHSAEKLGMNFGSYPIERPGDLAAAFAKMKKDDIGMLLLDPAHPYPTNWPVVAELALIHRIPSLSEVRDFVVAGGLMSYGASVLDITRRMAHYMDRIIKGASPAEMPVEQPTRFELALNLKTAKALDIAVPPSLLARTDEVIE